MYATAGSHLATKNQRDSNYQRNLLGLTGVTYDGFGMAFQALLFCPDDKTARTVTQVLGELEFTVEACTEPFAAVKKLMSQHFDALVVDCDNEQNATLLFKSARNSTSNQASLAVAIVEGQAGVAKAFRIGANLVLTKPINVEQSKGTLRVARGLLRKGEPVKPATPAPATIAASPVPATAAPAPVAPSAKLAPTRPVPSVKPVAPIAPALPVAARAVAPPVAKPEISVAAAQAAASSGLASQSEIDAEASARVPAAAPAKSPAIPTANKIAPPAPPAPKPRALAPPISARRPVFVGAPEGPVGSFGGGTASAPALAREAQVVPVPETAPLSVPHRAEDLFEKPAERAKSAPVVSSTVSSAAEPAPAFTFGGANAPEESGGGRNKIMLAIAAAGVVAAGLYVGWSYFQGRASQPVTHAPAVSTPSTATPTSALPLLQKPNASVPSSQPAAVNAQPTATQDNEEAAAELSSPTEARTSTPSTNSVSQASRSSAPTKPVEAPLVVKGGSVPAVHAAPATPDTPAPNVIGMAATGSGGTLSNLVDTTATAPRPLLQKVNVSQGVSQGLLMKKVQPIYPRTALAMHIEGVVELAATISKTGGISSVKVVKGDPQLTRAATDAVKQWKYKPYLLNGEPVEITTQVTITFKLPH